jgi:hypothetical protein
MKVKPMDVTPQTVDQMIVMRYHQNTHDPTSPAYTTFKTIASIFKLSYSSIRNLIMSRM